MLSWSPSCQIGRTLLSQIGLHHPSWCQHVRSWHVNTHRAACYRNLLRNHVLILLWLENFETCHLVQLQSVVKLEPCLLVTASSLIHLVTSKCRLRRYFRSLLSPSVLPTGSPTGSPQCPSTYSAKEICCCYTAVMLVIRIWLSFEKVEVHVYIRLLPHSLNTLHFFRIGTPGLKESEIGLGVFVKKCMKTGIRRVGCECAPADCYKGRSELASSAGVCVSIL